MTFGAVFDKLICKQLDFASVSLTFRLSLDLGDLLPKCCTGHGARVYLYSKRQTNKIGKSRLLICFEKNVARVC